LSGGHRDIDLLRGLGGTVIWALCMVGIRSHDGLD
jgi:hypothetical protein